MGREEYIRQGEERRGSRGNLRVGDIDHGMNTARLQLGHQCRFIDQRAPRRVDEGGAILHELQLPSADHVPRRGQRGRMH
ncbi:hypothetical protein D3C87_1822790 [compost metagenome]